MILSEPKLLKRSDKSEPKKNRILGEIEQYFTSPNKTCVHFGRSGDKFSVIKLLISDSAINDAVEPQTVANALLSLYPNREFVKDFTFFAKHNVEYEIIIIDDTCNWRTENNKLLRMTFKKSFDDYEVTIKTIEIIAQKDFQQYLVSKFRVNKTAKPLNYATSELEGYLSDVSSVYGVDRNDVTLFPGDVDLLCYSDDYALSNVFEFKKHTSSGYGELKDQSFMKYIARDAKKYRGIAEFCKSLGKNYFYNVIYSTRIGEEKIIKLEKVKFEFDKLVLEDSVLIEYRSKDGFINSIKNFCV